MCGIAGIVATDSHRAGGGEILRRMVARLKHRGPDAGGFHQTHGVHLGVRRLAVIDLPTGNQPIYNETGSVAVVFNGEIYNFIALRDRLRAKGHRFRTASDTEVIVHLYEEEGLNAFSQLNGMFAIALHDLERRRVVMARDRHGMKPLYWYRDARGLRFASEVKALFADPDLPRRPDLAALIDYLAHWYVPTPRTAFEGVRKLRPGHLMVIDEGGAVNERPFGYDVPHARPAARDLAEAKEIIFPALRDSVKRQLVADVPVGIFLSGGLDSSLIGALAARLAPKRLRAFTVSFNQHPSYDEAPVAKAVANAVGLEHTILEFPGNLAGLARETLAAFDEPFGDYSSIATMMLCREARHHATVCLAGDGGDEAFAGYRHYFAPRYAALFQRLPGWAQAGLERVARWLPGSFERMPFEYKARRFIRGAGRPPLEAQILYKSVFVGPERRRLLGPVLADLADRDCLEGFRETLEKINAADATTLERLLLLERATFMLDDDLVKVDQASMASSLEVRLPMLDDEVVSAARSIPERLLLSGGQTKAVLRAIARDLLPRQIAGLAKRGFTPPMSHWLAGPLHALVEEHLGEDRVRRAGLLRPEAVSVLLTEHRSRRRDLGRELWTLIALQEWWTRNGF